MADPITFPAIVAKVQTLADGGIRVTLDLPEQAIMAAAELMVCKREGAAIRVICEVLTDLNHATEEGTKGSTFGVDSRRRAIRRDQPAGG